MNDLLLPAVAGVVIVGIFVFGVIFERRTLSNKGKR